MYMSPKLFFADGQGNQLKRMFFTLRAVTRKRKEILGWVIKGQVMAAHTESNALLPKIG